MVAWTPNGKDNLRDSYECIIDYSPGQCLNEQTIPIEVGELLYSFEPIFNCFSGEITQTNVSHVLTSLFGGNPTLPYSYNWEFSFPDGTPTQNSTEFNPVVLNRASGSVVNAILTVSQGSFDGPIISKEITVPMALSRNEVIEDSDKSDTDKGMSNGIIDVTFSPDKDLFYFWTALHDDSFYSENSRIKNLSRGTYQLTTINNDTGTCRTDLFDISSTILPVKFIYNRTNYNSKVRNSLISWATETERKSSHFEIQRSIGAVNDFKKIGIVAAMGWKDNLTEYEFIDEDLPLFGGTMHYRIKQVDINETYAYSDVMSIRTPQVEVTKGVWRAYPNPTNGEQLRVGLLDRSQYDGEQIHFRLIHPSVQSKVTTVASEAEMNEALATMTGHIPKGVFVVEIQWGPKVEHIKVLKP